MAVLVFYTPAKGNEMRQNILNQIFLWAVGIGIAIFLVISAIYLSYLCFDYPMLRHPEELKSLLGLAVTFLMGAVISPFLKQHGVSERQ